MQDFQHPADIPIAIIGMGCRLPGGDDLEQYWKLLVEGRSAVVEVPPDRLNRELYYDPEVGVRGKTYSTLAALLSNRQFDRQSCPIPDELVRKTDNTHLLMCEVAASACRHAGLDPMHLEPKNTGVFIGHAQGSDLGGDYIYGTCLEEATQFLLEIPDFQALDANAQRAVIDELVARVREKLPTRTADAPDVASDRVAGIICRAFGLTGPFVAINSACASSLHAMLLGARALQLGRIEMAIVGGASDAKSDTLVLFSHARALSATGSRPFDADADGLICSEGYVALVMKTLPRALADGDPIQAVVRGLGISTDGKGKSLWAPRKEGQIEAMQRAYRSDVDISSLQYFEAHATATQLGDATELNTLAEVLNDHGAPGRKIPIGGVKANIGHALEAAGGAGVIKTVLAMQHGIIPPAINIKQLNPKIQWDDVPIYVPTEATSWDAPADGGPRRAGVNAFGIGGLNMHVVLEQFDESTRQKVTTAQLRPAAAQTNALTSRNEAIAIVGMGCVLPGALNVQEYWDLLDSGRDPKQSVPADRWNTELTCRADSGHTLAGVTPVGGFITNFQYDWRTHKVPPKQIAQADPLQFMLLDAADQALIDAGYDKKPFDRKRVGVLVGTEFGGDFAFQLQMGLRLPELENNIQKILLARGISAEQAQKIATDYSETFLKHWPALIDETGSFTTSSLASRISKTWNLMGGATAIDSGSASAMSALAISIDALLAGDCDMMICTAGQRRMGLPEFEALAISDVLAGNGDPGAPLDANANGFVPGEGVGVLLLKRLSDARRDGDRIRGVIRGIGAAHSNSWEDAVQMAAERALADADVAPADVRLAEIDTTGSCDADDEQFRAIGSVYGRQPRQRPLLLSSVAAQIGHAKGASGMAAMLKTCLELENRRVLATFGLQSPRPTIAAAPSTLQAAMKSGPMDLVSPDEQPLAAVNSISRKLAYHVIVQRGTPVSGSNGAEMIKPTAQSQAPEPAAVTSSADWRICRIGAASLEQLSERLAAVGADASSSYAGSPNGQLAPTDSLRMTMAADSPTTLAQKLQTAEKQVANPATWPSLENRGIFVRRTPAERPRIAFLFAGQGSQYQGMLHQLVRDVPAAATALADANAALTRLGHETFDQMMWQDAGQRPTDVWTPQASMLVADYMMFCVLADRGIHPDLVAGHSYGEYAALLAAGVWDLDTALRITRARCDAIEAAAALGGMLATNAPPEVVDKLAANLAPKVYVANHNAPDQTVVGGPREVLSQLAARLHEQSYRSQLLQVPCPFHTPWMKETAAPLNNALAIAQLCAPRIALWSVVTNQPVAEPNEIRANLVAHMTTPVRYVDLIRTIASQQQTVLIEVGPQQVLTRLHQRILRGTDVAAIATDNPKRPALEQLCNVQALLESVGMFDRQIDKSVSAPAPSVLASVAAPAARGEIHHFDATLRRREKMRDVATSKPGTSAAAALRATPAPTRNIGPSPAAEPTATLASVPQPPAAPDNDGHRIVVGTPSQSQSIEPQPTRSSGQPTAEAPQTQDSAQLEQFLINFVVEQTGYPADVVELDADLEADLGIDSIKKAQLFGELQEYFDVTPSEDLTLDDFPTLRHVLNFLRGVETKTDLVTQMPVQPEPVASQPVAVAPPTASEPAATQSAGATTPASEELERFLINFVVEQTGYPPDVVELDADLEADLGIDSIKKAQLFGELQEYFDVTPSEDLTLDDFPTLRHVLNFLRGVDTKTDLVTQMPVPPGPVAPQPVAVAPPTASEPAATPSVGAAAPASEELERFLINFVVEQTGYPPDVVELDADLEADLGIDSIKKAQLFGELQEYFDVMPSEDLTLDDFPTLRHVLNFLRGVETKTDLVTQIPVPPEPEAPQPVAVAPPTASEPAATPSVGAAAPASEELERFLINFVVEQTGYPPDVVELDADLEADLGIDSIKKAQLFGELQEYFDVTPSEDLTLDDFPTLRHVLNFLSGVETKTDLVTEMPVPPEPVASQPVAAAPSAAAEPTAGSPAGAAAPASEELEQFLINFVVEQTGYPPDVVELDADLEADLGIDSIKKAQLFGELQEYFDVTPSEDLTLDDFPTLRHVLNFLSGVETKTDLVTEMPESAPPNTPMAVGGNGQSNGTSSGIDVAASTPTTAYVVGPATFQQGHKYGIRNKDEIRQSLRRFADLPESPLANLAVATDPTWEPYRQFGRDELEQLHGIAEAVEVPLGNVIAYRLGAGPLNPPVDSFSSPPIDPPAVPEDSPEYDMDDETDSEVTDRYRMRMLEIPLRPGLPDGPTWQGAALIVGQNPDADALRRRLESMDVVVKQLPVTDDLDQTLAAFEQIWREQPTPHLFLTSARDRRSTDLYDDAAWRQRRYHGVTLPFFLCQRWVELMAEAKLLERATLVGLTALGGDFGFSGHAGAVDSGAITGLLKGICIEYHVMQGLSHFKVVAIDAPDDESPDSLAVNACRELVSGTRDYEVAFVGGQRRLQNAAPEVAAIKPLAEIRRDGTWVVTGGARGITAACALELGRRFGLRLHLIGTSALPQIDPAMRNLSEDGLKQVRAQVMSEARGSSQSMNDAWEQVQKAIELDRSLRAFDDAGIVAHYHQCDIADAAALKRVLDGIRFNDGPIEGIIHGAGIDKSCRFERKQRDVVAATVGAKVDGARNLMALTRDDPVRHFIGFGSISGRLGSNGQTDYCVASDMLAKLIDRYRSERPECHALCFHWHPWDEIGMAASPQRKAMIKASGGPAPMPKREGVRHFIRELYAGPSHTEVLITTPEYHGRFYGSADDLEAGIKTSVAAPAAPAPGSDVGKVRSPRAEPVAQRLVMRMIDAPLKESRTPVLNGAAVILGNNAAAAALERRLRSLGGSVHVLAASDEPDAVIEQFNEIWNQHAVTQLFLFTPHDEDARVGLDEADLDRRRTRGVLAPFLLCQHWFELLGQAGLCDKATLCAATALGGDFGISGNIAAVESGALTGLLKGLFIEAPQQRWDGIRFKVIDVMKDEPVEAVATAVCEELACDEPDIDVAYVGGKRRVVRAVVQPAVSKQPIARGGTWVVTGGARGITALVALELGRRYGLKLHLLGSTPPPDSDGAWQDLSEAETNQLKVKVSRQARAEGRSPAAAWNKLQKAIEIDGNLRAFQQAGVPATYYQCDVANRAQLASILDRIRQADGPIEGIVHGAGVALDAWFTKKKPENVLKTVAAKVDGAAALMALTENDPVRYFVGFGSVSGRFGAEGQSDYCAANDMLCKLIDWYRAQRPRCTAVGFHWHAWDGVGMAVKPELKSHFDAMQVSLMPPDEGIEHLINELEAGGPEGEVIITEVEHYRQTYPLDVIATPDSTAEFIDSESAVEAIAARPLIHQVTDIDPGRQVTADALFDPGSDPFLIEHQMGGVPLLPAVIAVELMVEAASLLDDRCVVGLRHVMIRSGMSFNTADPRCARVTVAATADGAECRVTSDHFDRQRRLVESQRLISSADIELANHPLKLTAPHCGEPPLGWFPMQYPDGSHVLQQGPKMQYLKNVFFQRDGGHGRILAPPIAELAATRGDQGWLLSPAVLDACLTACSTYSFAMCNQRVEIPQSFGRLRFACLPHDGEQCIVRIYYRNSDEKASRYDFVLFGDDERVILSAEDYVSAIVAGGEKK